MKDWTTPEDFRRDIAEHIATFEPVWKKGIDYDAEPCHTEITDQETNHQLESKEPMKLTSVTASKKATRHLSDNNYVSTEISVTVEVEEGENYDAVVASLFNKINGTVAEQLDPSAIRPVQKVDPAPAPTPEPPRS